MLKALKITTPTRQHVEKQRQGGILLTTPITMPVEFLQVVSPPLDQTTSIEAFSKLEFIVKIDVEPWTDPNHVIVEAWTNMRDRKNSKPGFRSIRLKYQGLGAGCCRELLYGASSVPVWVGDHVVTFRARERFRQKWSVTDPEKPAVVCIGIPEDVQQANQLPVFQFNTMCPMPLQTLTGHVYEQMALWLRLDVLPGRDPEKIHVQAWTNLTSMDHASATLHGLRMPYRGLGDDGRAMYGERVVLAAAGEYTVTYRARLRHEKTWTWLSNDGAGVVCVLEPRCDRCRWSSEFAEAPDYVHLVGPVHVGGSAAVLNLLDTKTSNLFTHLICMVGGNDPPEPVGLPKWLKQHRIPATEGIRNAIEDHHLLNAVELVRKIWQESVSQRKDRRLLIYSRYGFGRAASVAIAYVFADNPSMTFDQAVLHVSARRPVLPHAGLRETAERFWPRIGVDICLKPPVVGGKCRSTRFRWMSVSPGQQETISVEQFHEVVCYVKLQIEADHDPEQIIVEAWTNLRTPEFPEAVHRAMVLGYQGPSDEFECGAVYGVRTVATSVGEYDLTYRAKDCSRCDDWTWVPSTRTAGTAINVGPPNADKSTWAEAFRMAPESVRLVGPIYFGSEKAVLEAPPNARFTHILCVADELSRPEGLSGKVVFDRIPMQNGVENVIDDHQLSNAVDWMREVFEQYVSDDGKLRRAIVYCRYGFARAASVAIAFVLASHSSMTYEQAVEHVTSRRPTAAHVQLKDSIYRLYPRSWSVQRLTPIPPNRPLKQSPSSTPLPPCLKQDLYGRTDVIGTDGPPETPYLYSPYVYYKLANEPLNEVIGAQRRTPCAGSNPERTTGVNGPGQQIPYNADHLLESEAPADVTGPYLYNPYIYYKLDSETSIHDKSSGDGEQNQENGA